MPWWDPTEPDKAKSTLLSRIGPEYKKRPRRERARRDAESFAELLPTMSDGDGFGFMHRPYGTGHTGGGELRTRREKQPAIFASISAALERAFDRGMRLEEKKQRRRRKPR